MAQTYYDRAKNLADLGDYGQASVCIAVELTQARNANDTTRISTAQNLAEQIEQWMKDEFRYQARVERLAVTDENEKMMMFNHSPHIERREQYARSIFSEAIFY